jgi:anti-anti-sigma factor
VCEFSLAAEPVLPSSEEDCPECGYYLWCSKRMVDDVAVLHVSPERTPTATEVEHLVDSLAGREGVPRVVVDLSDLETGSSSFLARMLIMQERIQRRKGSFILCGLNRHCQEIFAFTRLDTILEIADDEKTALASL